jgi:hypothetical protein
MATIASLRDELEGQDLVIATDGPNWGRTDPEWCSKFTGAMPWYASRPSGRRFVWRGQSNAAWALQPRLHRHVRQSTPKATFADVLRAEEQILKEAVELQPPELVGLTSRLVKLAILQHHGVPTRLIDVTRDPLVAMFFAAQDSFDENGVPLDGAILAINEEQVDVTDQPDGTISLNPAMAPYGIWQPPPIDGRIISQRGYFLIASEKVAGVTPDIYSGIGIPGFEPKGAKKQPVSTIFTRWLSGGGKAGRPPLVTPNLAMFVVPHRRKNALRRLLDGFGLRVRTIYPDLAGYASSFPPS